MDELLRAVSTSAKTVSGTNLPFDSVDMFKKSMMQRFMAPVYEIAEEGEENVSDSDGQLAFLKSRYTLGA